MTRCIPGLLALAFLVYAQSTDARLTFEVASVKPAPPPDGRGGRVAMAGGPGTKTPDRINYENVSLIAVICKAYDVEYYQIEGLNFSERFNILATMLPGTTKQQFQIMLQNLLADRFKLKVHRVTKELAVYSLAVAKNGPKLKKAAPSPAPDAAGPSDGASKAGGGKKLARDAEGYPVLGPGMSMAMVGDHARAANKAHLDWLVNLLSGQLHGPVIDNTGLTGEYDFSLSWIPQPPDAGPSAVDDPRGPDLLQALQQQLGLKVESKKAPISVLIVDHAEKVPTEN